MRMTSSRGVEVSVPNYPKLKTLAEEADELRKTIRTLENRMGAIDLERQRGDMASMRLTERGEWEVRRAKLKAEYEAAEQAKETAKQKLGRAEHEYTEWQSNFATLLYKIKELQRELVTAYEGKEPAMVIGNAGPLRAKVEIENELLATIQNLANFSGDASVAAEARELGKQIVDSRPYVVLRTNHVELRDGTILTETDFQQRACEIGASHPSLQAARNAYPAGARVPRAKAQELNLT